MLVGRCPAVGATLKGWLCAWSSHIILTMTTRRNDNDGWTVEQSPDGTFTRFRVHPERVHLLDDSVQAILGCGGPFLGTPR